LSHRTETVAKVLNQIFDPYEATIFVKSLPGRHDFPKGLSSEGIHHLLQIVFGVAVGEPAHEMVSFL
jgi:hypothetical protein